MKSNKEFIEDIYEKAKQMKTLEQDTVNKKLSPFPFFRKYTLITCSFLLFFMVGILYVLPNLILSHNDVTRKEESSPSNVRRITDTPTTTTEISLAQAFTDTIYTVEGTLQNISYTHTTCSFTLQITSPPTNLPSHLLLQIDTKTLSTMCSNTLKENTPTTVVLEYNSNNYNIHSISQE